LPCLFFSSAKFLIASKTRSEVSSISSDSVSCAFATGFSTGS
jgi:hypothetical protein